MNQAETAATLEAAAPEKQKKTEQNVMPVKAAEVEEVAAKFDWSFPSAKKEEPDEAAAKESRSRLVEKVSAADRAEAARKAAMEARRDAEDEDEEDDIGDED